MSQLMVVVLNCNVNNNSTENSLLNVILKFWENCIKYCNDSQKADDKIYLGKISTKKFVQAIAY